MASREDAALLRPLTYSSEAILDRRQRMLTETWKMIAEQGMSGFSVRELCERAEVSQGTFYNAFGTRENAIALAVTEYAVMVSGGPYTHPPATLDGRIERLTRLHVRVKNNRRYIGATMSVFWSETLSSAAKKSMVDSSYASNMPYAQSLQRRRGLSPHLTVERLVETMMIGHYGLLTYWTIGGFPDEELARRVIDDFLLIVAGATRGAAAREVEAWRDDILADGPRWREFVEQAEDAAMDILA